MFMTIHLDTVSAFDGQTDEQTDGQTDVSAATISRSACIAC